MALLAVDVVLLPPEDIMDYAVDVNKELLKKNPPEIVLDKEKCLPHISLSMGVLDEEKLEEAQQVLEEVASNFSALQLSITGTTVSEHKNGLFVSCLDIQGEQIQKIHETVMNSFSSLLKQGIVEDVQWVENQQGEVPTIWKDWVKDFAVNSAFKNYYPHITIGFGKAPQPEKKSFTASRLALCHLGNYCTCRKILAEVELRSHTS